MYQLKFLELENNFPKISIVWDTKLSLLFCNLSANHSIKWYNNKTNLANSIRKFYLQRVHKVISSGSKAFFRFINKRRTNRSTTPPLKHVSGHLAINDKDKANALLAHFNSAYILYNKYTPLFPSVTSSWLDSINITYSYYLS